MQWRKIILFFLRTEGERRVERQVKKMQVNMTAVRFTKMIIVIKLIFFVFSRGMHGKAMEKLRLMMWEL